MLTDLKILRFTDKCGRQYSMYTLQVGAEELTSNGFNPKNS